METGENISLTVTAFDREVAEILLTSMPLEFVLDDAHIIDGDATGRVTDRAVGKSRVHISAGEISVWCDVVVYPATVSRLSVGERHISLGIRETRAIVVRAFDKRDNIADARLVYQSANAMVVTTTSLALKAGERVQVEASPHDALHVELSGRVLTWETSNATVVAVTSDGVVTCTPLATDW